ncbi:MAG: aminopeptidase [Actinomycetota bacterium]
MTDARVDALARILVDYSVAIKPHDRVAIRGAYVAEPLILAVYRLCLERGAYPMVRASLPRAEPLFYRLASDDQLEHVWETDKWLIENLDASISILSDTNTRQLSKVDPERMSIASRARKPLSDTFFERSATGEYRWNITLFPTEAHAMEAQMSLDEYEDLYYSACLVDADDPVRAWDDVSQRHARLIEWMKGRNEVHLEGEGTDLVLEVGGRTFVAANGHHNFPDGEIFTGPIEDRTRGEVSFSYPAIFGGQAVEGIRLRFEAGRVVEATAEKNERFLLETLERDAGAKTLGELGIGTNYGIPGFTGELLLDEKIGGTVHLALGAAYPETGGLNDSSLHWDMVCDLRRGGRVTVDGDVLMEDGKLFV